MKESYGMFLRKAKCIVNNTNVRLNIYNYMGKNRLYTT